MTVTESGTGTVDATFTVDLNAPSGRAVSVDYATAGQHRDRAGRLRSRRERDARFRRRGTSEDGHGRSTGDVLNEINETFTRT